MCLNRATPNRDTDRAPSQSRQQFWFCGVHGVGCPPFWDPSGCAEVQAPQNGLSLPKSPTRLAKWGLCARTVAVLYRRDCLTQPRPMTQNRRRALSRRDCLTQPRVAPRATLGNPSQPNRLPGKGCISRALASLPFNGLGMTPRPIGYNPLQGRPDGLLGHPG